MGIIAFAMSPRRGGNSETLLDEVIAGCEGEGCGVTKYRTAELDILPCTGCGGCAQNGCCIIDDAFTAISREMIGCDGIIFASPLYFMSLPAQGKALVDRCQAFWAARHDLGIDLFGGRLRPGLLVAVAGAGKGPGGGDVFRGLDDTMKYVFEALGLTALESVRAPRVDSQGDVDSLHYLRALARQRGVEMAQVAMNCRPPEDNQSFL